MHNIGADPADFAAVRAEHVRLRELARIGGARWEGPAVAVVLGFLALRWWPLNELGGLGHADVCRSVFTSFFGVLG